MMAVAADAGVSQLAELFSRTVANDKAVIQQAEDQLKSVSQQPGYAVTVLKVVAAGDSIPLDVRLAAAINFKNLVKHRWVPTDVAEEMGTKPIPTDEKTQIKALITGLMLSTPPIIRAQLSEALTLISDQDFPALWPTLLPELVQQLATEDLSVIEGVCHTANSIFKRYRNQATSNDLVAELDKSQQQFAPTALATLQKVSAQLPALHGNPQGLRLALSCVRLLCRIFFSLNSPGVTPLMAEQLDAWMEHFNSYLTLDLPAVEEKDADKEGPLDGVKAAVCANINLFMEMNEDDFAKYLQTFVTNVWHLLVKASTKAGQDNLAMSAIRFLTTVARSVHHTLFQGPGVLQQVCEAIVLPNLQVREEDENCFEMNPIEYIRQDSEGSDSDTRRRAAADLVRALTEKFEAQVTEMFTGYVGKLLQEYASNPRANWKAKDTAVYLVLAVTVKGRTGERGATTTNSLVQVDEFFTSQVLPELQAQNVNTQPMLKADALKFVTTFRSQLPPATAGSLFPSFIRLLGSESVVVHSYAATAIERFLALKEGGKPRLPVDVVSPYASQLLEAMFGAFKLPDSSENEYVMKAIMRLIMYLGPAISPVVPLCLQMLTGMLAEVCKNPKSPGFNHYLFESVAALVKYGVAADPANLPKSEDLLFPAFDSVLTLDVQEFHPYVFQVLAQLIELSVPPLRQSYMVIFPGLLTPIFWERPGNIPPLARLIVAYLTKASAAIAAAPQQLTAVLGVFQKLVASKANDVYGFQILTALVEHLPVEAYQQYMGTLWGLLFTRLQGTRTPKFARGFTLFVAAAVCKLGAVAVANSMSAVQPGIFPMVMDQVWIPTAGTGVEGGSDDKLVAVAAVCCLTNCPVLFEARPVWDKMKVLLEGKLAGATMAADAAGAASAAAAGGADDDGLPEVGYTAAYSKLMNAPAPQRAVLADIPDARQYAEGRLAQFINNGYKPIAD